MDAIFKTFSLGFLLRSVFAGVFFVIAYCVASTIQIDSNDIFKVGLPFALIAGVIVYGIHRSLLYPLIEWPLNSEWAEEARRTCMPLISKRAIKGLVGRWDRRAEGGRQRIYRQEQIMAWADFIHLQYTAAWCVVFGFFLGQLVNQTENPNKSILWFALLFFVAAIVANWRALSVEEKWPEIKEEKKDEPSCLLREFSKK